MANFLIILLETPENKRSKGRALAHLLHTFPQSGFILEKERVYFNAQKASATSIECALNGFCKEAIVLELGRHHAGLSESLQEFLCHEEHLLPYNMMERDDPIEPPARTGAMSARASEGNVVSLFPDKRL